MRRIFVLFCMSLLGAIHVLPPAAGAATADWPHDGASSARRHWNRDEVTISAANVARLQRVDGWVDGYAPTVNQTPIVANGRIFTVREVYHGLECPTFTDSSLEARTVDTAASLWSRSFDGYTLGPPAVQNGLLYLLTMDDYGCDNSKHVATIWAMQPASGSVAWKRAFPAGGGPYRFAVEGDLVVAAGGGPNTFFLNAVTGALRKKAAVGATSWEPVIKAGITYLEAGGKVRAFTKWGTPLSTWQVLSSGRASIAATSELLYIVEESRVRAVKPATGAVKFTIQAPAGSTFWYAAVDNARIYVTGTSLFAYDRYSGARRWTSTLRGEHVVANGVVYLVDQNAAPARVSAVNAATGQELWYDDYDGYNGFSTQPVIANGRLYVGGGNCECSSAFWSLIQYRLA